MYPTLKRHGGRDAATQVSGRALCLGKVISVAVPPSHAFGCSGRWACDAVPRRTCGSCHGSALRSLWHRTQRPAALCPQQKRPVGPGTRLAHAHLLGPAAPITERSCRCVGCARLAPVARSVGLKWESVSLHITPVTALRACLVSSNRGLEEGFFGLSRIQTKIFLNSLGLDITITEQILYNFFLNQDTYGSVGFNSEILYAHSVSRERDYIYNVFGLRKQTTQNHLNLYPDLKAVFGLTYGTDQSVTSSFPPPVQMGRGLVPRKSIGRHQPNIIKSCCIRWFLMDSLSKPNTLLATVVVML